MAPPLRCSPALVCWAKGALLLICRKVHESCNLMFVIMQDIYGSIPVFAVGAAQGYEHRQYTEVQTWSKRNACPQVFRRATMIDRLETA